MALGVLNNLSAIYAENNLNNTNSSLQTVLQQLSSGSKINSGADDAAGLSLVNGLGANSSALTQSETNATEGVGLLQVADGALSQVTSLLNRAITLATEASNGTLNSTQEGAANQEYQSILSEINNIGQTTTYNQQQVFNGQKVAIYTGDSSAAGSSIDQLNIRTLSEASMGDTGGSMAYSDGSSSVFINLSNANASTGVVTNAQDTDTLNANGTTTINVNYLVKGANGTESSATTSISAGKGTNYSNTADGLISAINNSGLGLTASFTTQAQAGLSGGGSQTGIEITGGLLSAGVDPSTASTSGILTATGLLTGENLTAGQVITVDVGGTTAAAITINSTVSNLAQLASAINTATANGGPSTPSSLVTASVITNSDGTQSLSLADSKSTGGALSVTSTGGTPGTSTADLQNVTSTPGNTGAAQTKSSLIVGTGDNVLSGTLVLTNGTGPTAVTETFVIGGITDASKNTVGVAGTGLDDLKNAINGVTGLGLTAAVNAGGLSVKSSTTDQAVDATGNLVNTNSTTGVASSATWATDPTSGVLSVGGIAASLSTDVLTAGTSIVITNGSAAAQTFVIGGTSNLGTNTVGVGSSGADSTLGALATQIGISGTNMTATVLANGLTIASTIALTNSDITVGKDTLSNGNATLQFDTPLLGSGTPTVAATAVLALTDADGTAITKSINPAAALTGSIVLKNNGIEDTFVMGNGPTSGVAGLNGVGANSSGDNVIYTGGTGANGVTTIADLEGAISNSDVLTGDTLSLTAADGPSGGIYLQSSVLSTNISLGTGVSNLAVSQGLGTLAAAGDTVTGATGTPAVDSTVLIATGTTTTPAGLSVSPNATLTGSVVITNPNSTVSTAAETFVMGGASTNAGLSSDGKTYTVQGNTLADLASAVTSDTKLGLTALAGSSGLQLTSTTAGSSAISVASNTLVDNSASANLSYTGNSAYNIGLSGNIGDSITGQSGATYSSNAQAASGVATISYSDGAGEALNGTDLSNQSDAESALNDLNIAISDVASQDGYIGAQINTLNSISQVMSTQQENVVSAQNAIQATDYASATSNMSKYEILSQTGIAALAQANTVQQEVTKLLQ